MPHQGRKPTCLCGKCPLCRRRIYLQGYRARGGYHKGTPKVERKVEAYKNFKPETVRPEGVDLDAFALKWLQDRGYR